MKIVVSVFTVLLCLCFINAEVITEDIQQQQPVRVSSRHEEVLDNDLEERASMLFRRFDTDHDKKIGEDDIRRSEHVLAEQMPGITVPQFIQFMEKADLDNDKHMNHEEFVQALAQGLQEDKEEVKAPEFIETTETVSKSRGIFGDVVNNAKKHLKQAFNKATNNVDTSQDGCVMCQYVVERIDTNVKASGIIPGLGAPGPAPADAFAFLEVEKDTSLVETAEKGAWHTIGASIIGSSRQTTRYQRQLERQKYNEIYRVADITLDDVCEQGMPNKYYGFCKSIYKIQSDVVNGLRYQYRPQDICFRVGMCNKESYIAKGIHSRYRVDN